MPNSIATFKKYTDLLDEVYKNASLTGDLESDSTLASFNTKTHEFEVPSLSMDGLANYSRNSGYVNGDVTLTVTGHAPNFDRGRSFSIDSMDDEETAGVAYGKLSAEFVRTKVVPELDAFRFAKYCSLADSNNKVGATLTTGAAVLAAIRAGVSKLDEAEVPQEQRYLYITPTLLGLVEDLDTTKSREVLNGFAKVVKVPQTRFYTAIVQKDGTTSGQEAGGFAKATGGSELNFMIVEKSAIIQYTKHVVSKVITPDVNQDADAYKIPYRNYGLADVFGNKTAGVYAHYKSE